MEQAQTAENAERVWTNGHRKALAALATGATFRQAAAKAIRDEDTLLRWRREDPAYAEAVEAAMTEARWVHFRGSEQTIYEARDNRDQNGNVTDVALRAALKTAAAHERRTWGDSTAVTGADGGALIPVGAIQVQFVRPKE